MKKIKSNQLVIRKEVVAKLSKSDMQLIEGGQMETMGLSCGARCLSAHLDCSPYPLSNVQCQSFAEGPTCGGTICGSDIGCTGTGYTIQVCTTEYDIKTNGFPTRLIQCSYCVC